MPMTRFEIRNEYGLADSELYRAADKDDPEALLEGVAMAGLVGVLRQLGDLAEFAAEIFHNLHEEVMATASRGHSLMTRVQQLETEVPSIEKAFLSQTDHSSIFYRAGVDWHPNLQIDTNLVTRGDLPRFILDSYGECKAPPRLFLLDKFDVSGAGACLKRYTDPSFFKVETVDMTSSDAQREKKILKIKKKGPHGRNGETTDAVPTSHTKLHQLFLEERTVNGVNKNSHRVKLKRRLNGFPFDSKTGKSYMEKILKSPSSDHQVLHEVDINSLSPLMIARSDENEFLEALAVRPVSPDRGCVGRDGSLSPSQERKDFLLIASAYEPGEVTTDDQISMTPSSYYSLTAAGISSEKDVAVEPENLNNSEFTGSNFVASEAENYEDATSIMETEMDTEAEIRKKSDDTATHRKSLSLISDVNEEHHSSWISDCQSSGDSVISDEGINSSRKGMPSCSVSDSASTLAENPLSEKSANRISSSDPCEIEIVATSYQNIANDNCISEDAINQHTSDYELNSLHTNNASTPTIVHSGSEVIVTEDKSKQPEYDSVAPILDGDDNKFQIRDQPSYPIASDLELQSGDNTASLYGGQHLENEPKVDLVPCSTTGPDFNCRITDSSGTSSDLLHGDEADQKDQNLVENMADTSNMLDVVSQRRNDDPEMIPATNPVLGEMGDEVPKFLDNLSSSYPDKADNEDVIKSTVSQEEILPNEVDIENSCASTDSPNCPSDMMEASFGQHLNETLLMNAQTVGAEDNYSNCSTENLLSSENLLMSHLTNSPDWPVADDADEEDLVLEQNTKENETSVLGSPTSCDVVELQAAEMKDCIFPSDSEVLKSSFHTMEKLEEPSGTSDTVERDGITQGMSSSNQEVAGISGSTDLELPNETNARLDEPDSEGDKSNTDMASTMCSVSDNTIVDNVHSNVDFHNVVEAHVHCPEDSGLDELENDMSYLSGSHGESGLVEGVGQTEAAASDSEAALCSSIDYDQPKLGVSEAVPHSHLDLEVDNRWEFVDATTVQPPLEQSGSGTELGFCHQSGRGNDVPDAKSLTTDYGTEESKTQEKNGLLPNGLDQELSCSGEIISELSPLFPISHLPLLDHGDHKDGDNDFVPTFSPIDCPNPASTSELRKQSDYDESGYPTDPLGSIFNPNNPFTETNKINLADLPPLPPLPPVQWRMGKFQPDSASAEGGVMKHKELSPQSVALLNESADDVSSSLVNTSADGFQISTLTSADDFKTSLLSGSADGVGTSPQTSSSIDDVSLSPLTKSTDYVSLPVDKTTLSSLDEATNCPTQTAPKPESEEKTKNSGSMLQIKDMNEIIDVVPIGDKQQQSVVPTPKIEFTSPEEPKNSCSTLEIKDMHEALDVVPNIGDRHQQSAMPVPKSEFTSPEEDDGVSHGSRPVKLPRPRNPLVEDVAVLDKSKLRKVTERDRPQIQKGDERDAFLEQIRNKSFNLKPAMASRPSMQHPKTNLRVAAILEKANAIRQALADSDEDDDDCWSDS